MAFHNVNWSMVPLTSGTYTEGDLGNGLTASSVHQIYCLTTGSITLTDKQLNTVTFNMTSGQTVNLVVAQATVNSGTYVGFKTYFQNNNANIFLMNNSAL